MVRSRIARSLGALAISGALLFPLAAMAQPHGPPPWQQGHPGPRPGYRGPPPPRYHDHHDNTGAIVGGALLGLGLGAVLGGALAPPPPAYYPPPPPAYPPPPVYYAPPPPVYYGY